MPLYSPEANNALKVRQGLLGGIKRLNPTLGAAASALMPGDVSDPTLGMMPLGQLMYRGIARATPPAAAQLASENLPKVLRSAMLRKMIAAKFAKVKDSQALSERLLQEAQSGGHRVNFAKRELMDRLSQYGELLDKLQGPR